MYRLTPKYSRDTSAARIIVLAVFLLLITLSCGGYGIQLWQHSGLSMALPTLLGALILGLGALVMIAFGIRGLRANRLTKE
jgi:hypothetical protein